MAFYQHHQVTKRKSILFNLLLMLTLGLILVVVDIRVIRNLKHHMYTTDHLKNLSETKEVSETTTEKLQVILTNFNDSNAYNNSEEVSETTTEKLQVILTNFNDSNAYNNSEDILNNTYYSTPPPTEEPIVFTIITDIQKNWFGAFEDCRTRGLYLASILNETELMEVSRQINDLEKSLQTAGFWLSATDLPESNSYVWMTMGDNVSDQPWFPRLDSSSKQDPLTGISKHCMGLRYNETANCSTVNEEVCSDYNYYICVNRGGSKSTRNTNFDDVVKQGNKNFSIVNEKKVDLNLNHDSNAVIAVEGWLTQKGTVQDGSEHLYRFPGQDWYGALVGCEKKGLRLVNIESEEDQQAVVDLIRSQDTATDVGTSFWLGGSDLGQVDEYVWMTSGQRFNFTAWLSVSSEWFHYAEPDQELIDGEQEHCVALEGDSYKGYKWIDYRCSAEKFYICVMEH